MLGFAAALVLLAQAATYGPAAPAKPAPPPQTPQADCAAQSPTTKGSEIVICAPKPDGYRLPPDVVEARRLKKKGDAGRPRSPHETYADHGCTVGPMACTGRPTVNMLAVAGVAAEISQRMAKGQEVGSIFETTPSQSEYQLYQEAKRRREAKEAAAAAKAVQAQAQAAASASQPPKPGN